MNKNTIQSILDKVTVVSPDQAEECDIVLCMESKPENEANRVKGSIDVACDGCGVMVMLAPSSPTKPKKLCLKCVIAMGEDSQSLSE